MKLLVINGPNLNLLGIREKSLYGTGTYERLVQYIQELCTQRNIDVTIFQSNHEGAIVDAIQAAYQSMDAIVINPAAYTHTSIAILDALKAVALPAVEVHLTDIQKREEFRHVSYAGMACEKTVAGLGFEGYREAINYLYDKLSSRED
jgi:3-dehydroquinate dehydratase II